jgi:hypothetical protein
MGAALICSVHARPARTCDFDTVDRSVVQVRQLRGEQRGDADDAARAQRVQDLLQRLRAHVGQDRQCSAPTLPLYIYSAVGGCKF